MEWWWIFLVIFLWWDEIFGFIKKVYNDISNISDVESYEDEEELDTCEDEEELDAYEDEEEIESNPNTIPTVTRVSGADLISKTVNRPTVINRKS